MKASDSAGRQHHATAWFLLLCFVLALAVGFLGGLTYSQRVSKDSLQQAPVATADPRADASEGASAPSGTSPMPDAVVEQAPVQVFFAPEGLHPEQDCDGALLAFIGSAQKSILCAFYDFELEPPARALVDKFRAGIRVAIVSDSDYQRRPGIRFCRDAGIPVVFDGRTSLMHNKFCVVDGSRVWTGSTNITSNCMYRNNNNSILIESPELASNFSREFDEMFSRRRFGEGSPADTPYPAITVADTAIECYFAPEDHVERAVVAHLRKTERAIDFMAFSFTSVPIARAMAEELSEGARVRGVIERRNAGASHSRDDFLRERGAEVFLDTNPDTMHHKVIVVDERLVMTGSYNFSANAEKRNDENLIVLHNPEIARRFVEEFESLIP